MAWKNHLEYSQKNIRITAGTLKRFNESKGYSFIESEGGEDCFVQFSEIQSDGFKTLNEGQSVEFEKLMGQKSLQASNVIPKQKHNPLSLSVGKTLLILLH